MQADISFAQGDAVRPQILKESQVILGDLPIGYYPDDQIASRYQVASPNEHTYAHHLLMEQSLKYLEKDGFAILLAPNDLLTSPQSDLLKGWLQEQANIVAMIACHQISLGRLLQVYFVLQKKAARSLTPFVYPLQSLQEPEAIQKFMLNFKIGSKRMQFK